MCIFVYVLMPKKGRARRAGTVGDGGCSMPCIEYIGSTCMKTASYRSKEWWPDICLVFLHYATLHTAPGMFAVFHRKAATQDLIIFCKFCFKCATHSGLELFASADQS